ncbi:MAG: hypothetical protein ACJ8DC_07555, partial [Gemmatimonadales bacterium]
DISTLPAYLGHVGLAEYHAPPPDTLPTSVTPLSGPALLAGRDAELRIRVVDGTPPDSAVLFIRPAAGPSYRDYTMHPAGAYEYAAVLPAADLQEGPHDFVITVFRANAGVTFPGGLRRKPTAWNYSGHASWTLDVVGPQTPLRLFDPDPDAALLSFSRIGDAGRRGLFHLGLSEITGRPVFHLALPVDSSGWSPPDYTASLVVTDRIRSRQATITNADAVRLRLRGLGPHQLLHVTLMEDDGTSWTTAVPVDSSWSEPSLPLAGFGIGRGVLLPEGFPGEWNYWVGPAEGRGDRADRPRLDHLERLQLSLRREDGATLAPEHYGVEVEWVTLQFGARVAP